MQELFNNQDHIIINTQRSINELREGLPIILKHKNIQFIVMSPESIMDGMFDKLCNNYDVELLITANRANNIKYKGDNLSNINKDEKLVKCKISSDVTLSDIENIVGVNNNIDILDKEYNILQNLTEITQFDELAINIAKYGQLLPSLLIFKKKENGIDFDKNLLTYDLKYVDEYKEVISYDLKQVCELPLHLEQTDNCKILAFRPNVGGNEHYAIIIGDIGENPLVRVHSSCYTGDLLYSLACDCKDQLHTAIDIMSKDKGGIILYMMQEGRGIGLVNKLRAYILKEQNFDTVDANNILGFDDDERLFLPAAKILENIGVKSIKLLTNNPRKADGLGRFNIDVLEIVPHIMKTNKYNEDYLKTKQERLGHKL